MASLQRAVRLSKRAAQCALLLAATAPGVARSNMRAPRTEPAMPSSAMGRPAAGTTMRVLKEDLTFHCRDRMCRVKASYWVESERAMKVGLDFILPVEAHVIARLGSAAAIPAVTSVEPISRDLSERLKLPQTNLFNGAKELPLYRASVAPDFPAGINKMSFEYDQPLAAIERGYGYFSKGVMVPEFRYVLWPLREWARASDFAIDLRVEIEHEPPSWWKRTFGHRGGIACDDVPGKAEQVGSELVFRARIGEPFPDILRCQIGEGVHSP
jgi:hypothetical protein